MFPPGFPTALVALGVRLGLDPQTWARVLCVACAAATVVLAWLVLRAQGIGAGVRSA